MNKPVLYLDVVGTLLLEKGGEMAVSSYAEEFVQNVQKHFRPVLVTSLAEHQAMRVAKAIGLSASFIAHRKAMGKSSAIDFRQPFVWVDANPTPSDLLRLSDERCSERLIPVNRREGVTEQTLRKVIMTLQEIQGIAQA